MPSTTRFLYDYLRPRERSVTQEETSYRRGAEALPATLYRPARAAGPLPGWVALQGLSCHGRQHPELVRFSRALAAAGFVVFVPEIPEWTRLEVSPSLAVETIRLAVLELDARDETVPGRTGVIGFSFGATQALVASVDERLDGHLAGIAAWGGYADLHRLFHFGLTGEHELDGRHYHREQDPYGLWIMAGNFMTAMPGYEGYRETARALHRLAVEAGRSGIGSWAPAHDARKARLRLTVPADQRELFDRLAPPTDRPRVVDAELRRLPALLADAALRVDRLLDPGPWLPRVRTPTVLAHGRDDRLVPYTELVRLRRALPPSAVRRAGITSLYGHSAGSEERLRAGTRLREDLNFLRLLDAIVKLL